jgi:hypothetical protein
MLDVHKNFIAGQLSTVVARIKSAPKTEPWTLEHVHYSHHPSDASMARVGKQARAALAVLDVVAPLDPVRAYGAARALRIPPPL